MVVIWKTIYENLYLVYGIVGINLLVSISITVGKKCVIGPNSINHRRLWSYFEFYILFMTIVSTLTAAVSRIINGFIAGLIGMSRIDKPIIPKFILEEMENKDE